MSTAASMVVVGSVNRDLRVLAARRPEPGETVLGRAAIASPGGKGANQAVAAARAGARPYLVGAVGGDAYAAEVVVELAGRGVDVSRLDRRESGETGTAVVVVTDDGQNSIIVVPGANGTLTVDATLAALDDLVAPGTLVLTQAEIPGEVVEAVVRFARARDARTVLNLAPHVVLAPDVLAGCDPLVVNESEAAAALGRAVRTRAELVEACRLLAATCRSVVLTLGPDGALIGTGDEVRHVPGHVVEVVDTTGAGDAFVGVLAARLSQGADLLTAVEAGNLAGARAVGAPGAQPPPGVPAGLPVEGADRATPVAPSADREGRP
ncbi:MAG TPA: ribokinase [Cellulomonas sp.]